MNGRRNNTMKRNKIDESRELSYLDVYPPFRAESMEDIYSTVALMSEEDGNKREIVCVGLLILSNYRLIFVDNMRASVLVAKHAIMDSNMTISIFLGDIIDISLTTIRDKELDANVETIIIKTISARVYRLGFLAGIMNDDFNEDSHSTWKPPEEVAYVSDNQSIQAKSWFVDNQLIHNFARGTFVDSKVQDAFYLLCGDRMDPASHIPQDNYSQFDESFEGHCAERMLKRIRWKVQNRYLSRIIISRTLSKEIDMLLGISRGTGNFHSIGGRSSSPSTPVEANYNVNMKMSEKDREIIIDNYVQSWKLYDPMEEFKRMGILKEDSKWRLCDLNIGYDAISTYPEIIVVPAEATDTTVLGSIKFRSKGRIPALSYLNQFNNCSITRCSQPLVGMTGKRSDDDERILRLINETTKDFYKDSNNNKPLIIADARPKINAQANQAAGKGYEFERNYGNMKIVFLGIANIHVMRKSLEMAIDVCTSSSEKSSFLKGICV